MKGTERGFDISMLRRTTRLSTGIQRTYPNCDLGDPARRSARAAPSLTVQCRIASNCGLFVAPKKRRKIRTLRARSVGFWAMHNGAVPGAGRNLICVPMPIASASAPEQVHSRRRLDNDGHQTHISTFQSKTRTHARVPGSHEIARRTCGHRRASCQGPQATGGLKAKARPVLCTPICGRGARPAPATLRAGVGCGGRRSSSPCAKRTLLCRCAHTAAGCR